MGTKLGSGTGVASMVVVRVVVVRVVGMVEVGLGLELEAEEMATGWAVEARANVMEEMVMVGAGMAVVCRSCYIIGNIWLLYAIHSCNKKFSILCDHIIYGKPFC